MAVVATRPSGRRADDIRALRIRMRTLTFSGTYTTGGEVITSQSLSLKRILVVIPCGTLVRGAGTAAGVLPVFDVSADGRTLNIRMGEDAAGAAGTFIGQEKTNGEAYQGTPATLDVLIVGEG